MLFSMANIEDLINLARKQGYNKKDLDLIRDAYNFAEIAHKGQKRKTGEPYLHHPFATAMKLVNMRMDAQTIAAGLLHDVPKEFKWFEKNVIPEYKKRMEELDNIKIELEKNLDLSKIKSLSLHGRKKHYYSLYQKLLRPHYNKDLSKIFDLVAIRIIAPTVSDCYKVLGIIHSQWKPLPGRIKDYIAQPKPNNYQSLHTTVVTPGGKIVEFQIRTQEMHEQAEFGIAAHWHYKEGGMNIFSRISGFHPKGYNPPKKLKWIQELAEWQKNIIDNTQYINALKTDAL